MIRPARDLPPIKANLTVPLVPNSGVQFLDVPLAVKGGRRHNWFEAPHAEGIAALKALERDQDSEGYYYLDGDKTCYVDSHDEGFIAFDTDAALRPFMGAWVPVPFLLEEQGGEPGRRRLSAGPENWARIRIVKLAEPEPGNLTHRAVLAFDTSCTPRTPRAPFLTPWQDEPARFVLGTMIREVAWLLDRPWMKGWIADLYRGIDQDRRGGGDAPIGCRHFAAYLTFLAALEDSGAIPMVRLVDLAAAEKQKGVIDVDLVLDVGNSRTCGFLVERVPGRPAGVTDSCRRLMLRDISAPEETYDRPFESRVEFARAAFGREDWSLSSGHGNAFEWPSPVRIGPEAVRLSARNRGNEGQTGMSSPKRYVWDERAAVTAWRFNVTTDADGVIGGHFLEFLAEDGTVKSFRNKPGIALRSMFSRASLYTLFLLEVLLQARSQVNSYGSRYGRQDLTAPRRLARLILTLPAAMPIEEIQKVEARAKAAASLLDDVTGVAPPPSGGRRTPRIEVEARLDEATATQIVYLYDQINHAYRDAPAYFELVGRPRPDQSGRPQPSLRIASIDVGGGTTDLAIYSYRLNDRVVVPKEEFREGFRLAGDDVLEMVVMRHVMPGLRKALADAGLGTMRAQHRLVEWFRVPPATEPERQSRRLVLNHVLVPAALAILREYETWNPMASGSVEVRTLRELIGAAEIGLSVDAPAGQREPPGARAAAWLDERAESAGASGFSTMDATVNLDFGAVHETVRQTLRSALEPMLEMVHRFECDVLLLSGRVACWPALAELVVASHAVEPNRVQPMHRYRVGAWYPYADAMGRIADPKTTVAVGAMICRLLQGGQLENLAMVDVFRMRSTARYIGLMEDRMRIRDDRIVFSGIDMDDERAVETPAEHALQFSGRCFLGFRQFRAERWPASPLYRIEFASADAAARIALPLTIQMQAKVVRDEPSGGVKRWMQFDLGAVIDANGAPVREGSLQKYLQTLHGDDGRHWLDAGQLDTLDSVLTAVPADA